MYIVRHGIIRFITGHASRPLVRTVDAELSSFETLSRSWAKDHQRVFFRGEAIPGLSPSDLHCSHGLIKTKSDIYFDTSAMSFETPVDVPSFRPLGGPFYQDDTALYCLWYSWDDFTCERLDADVASFEYLSECFARDEAGLFAHVHRVPAVDARTFSVFHSQFARDKDRVYLIHRGDKHTEHTTLSVVEGADPASFEVFHEHYARDEGSVYFFDDCKSLAAERYLLVECVRVDTPHPGSFVPLANQETGSIIPDGFDGTKLFLRGRPLELGHEGFRVVATAEGVHLEYVDLDRVSVLVAADYQRFFPADASPEVVDPDSLGPIDFEGTFQRTSLQSKPRPVTTPPQSSDDDIPF